MSDGVTAKVDEIASRLERLRDGMAGRAEAEVRDACASALDEALGSVKGSRRDAVLGGLRQRLIDSARERWAGGAGDSDAADRVRQLEAECDRLKQEVESLRQRASAAGSGGGGGSMDAFREGMQRIAAGKKLEADKLGLAGDDGLMLELCNELLRFAQDYEMGVNLLRAEMNVGQASGMDTQMLQGLKQQIRKRFRAALERKPGALEELRKSLNANAKFIVELNTAYSHALSTGSQQMLGKIDPQEILDKHKRMLGHDFEKAFQDILREHGDLAQLSRKELWERFFADSFRDKIDNPS